MSIIIDIIIIVIIALCILEGYKRGLVGMAFSIISFFVALIIAFILFNPVATFIIDNTELDENIKNAIIDNFVEETGQTQEAENMSDAVTNYIDNSLNEIKNIGVISVAHNIATITIKALSFIGVFIIAKLILIFFRKFADLIAKLPLIKQVNKGGGIIVGLIKALIIIYLILAILSLIMPLFAESALYGALNKAIIGGMMYNNNLLLNLIF